MKLLLKSNEILWYWLGLRFIQPVYGRYWYVENPVVEYYKYELFLGDSYHSTLNPKFNSKFSLINRIRFYLNQFLCYVVSSYVYIKDYPRRKQIKNTKCETDCHLWDWES